MIFFKNDFNCWSRSTLACDVICIDCGSNACSSRDEACRVCRNTVRRTRVLIKHVPSKLGLLQDCWRSVYHHEYDQYHMSWSRFGLFKNCIIILILVCERDGHLAVTIWSSWVQTTGGKDRLWVFWVFATLNSNFGVVCGIVQCYTYTR